MEAKNEQYSKTGLMGCFCGAVGMVRAIKAFYNGV